MGERTQKFRGPTRLHYALDEHEGADKLLVAFPKLRVGRAKPPIALRPHFAGVQAHLLYIGSDEHKFIGPERRLEGLNTAVELIGREADRLGIAREKVVCAGTSMGAVVSLMAGLVYGAGRIIVGAAPVKMGTAVVHFASREGIFGVKAHSASFVEIARTADGGDPVEFLDRFIFDLALEHRTSCRIDLVVSPGDYANASAREFAEAARANPVLDVEVYEEDYRKHGDIGEKFYPLLRRLLAEQDIEDEAAA